MKCEYCGDLFSEDELDAEGYCEDCNEQHRCQCGAIVEDLNEDGLCDECFIGGAIDMKEGYYESRG